MWSAAAMGPSTAPSTALEGRGGAWVRVVDERGISAVSGTVCTGILTRSGSC
jgi:hypothetical protein